MNYFSNPHNTRSGKAVINLIIINVIVYLGGELILRSRQVDISQYYALWNPWDSQNDNFRFWQPFTSMFLHADLMHLLFNMLGVYFFGRMLEQVWGTKRFLIYYFVSGIGASVVYLLWSVYKFSQGGSSLEMVQYGADFAPCVGASGAVFGLLIGAAMLFPNTQFLIYGIIPMRLGWLAILYGSYELLMIVRDSPYDRVAHVAHVGGLIFGFIMLQIYKRQKNNFY
ncbi:MAG: rhomboid family intramembrane serine protease [Bacteroidia bacterium]|jgi:membrane associated rhomboid family serine protease|nr:rhomboid family intramembrane serine protease [Bacteroidia bacterium]